MVAENITGNSSRRHCAATSRAAQNAASPLRSCVAKKRSRSRGAMCRRSLAVLGKPRRAAHRRRERFIGFVKRGPLLRASARRSSRRGTPQLRERLGPLRATCMTIRHATFCERMRATSARRDIRYGSSAVDHGSRKTQLTDASRPPRIAQVRGVAENLYLTGRESVTGLLRAPTRHNSPLARVIATYQRLSSSVPAPIE